MEDRIDQNQSADFLRTDRDSIDAQFDWQATDLHALGVGAMHYTEDASTESYGFGLRRADRFDEPLRAGPHHGRVRTSRCSRSAHTDHETAGSAVTWNAEYGYSFNAGRTRAFALAGSGFRAPDATDRYGYRRQPRARARAVAQLRGRRAARA